MNIKRMNILLGISSTYFITDYFFDFSMVDCSNFEEFNKDKKFIISLKTKKNMTNNLFVYFDEYEAVKKLAYSIADETDWINFNKSTMNLNVPKNCVAKASEITLQNVVVSKAYIIGKPLLIFSSKNLLPSKIKIN